MKQLKVICPAKLNLYLDVVGRYPDKFHKIVTIFERINLCDEIIIRSSCDNKIHIKSDNKTLPVNKKNLVFQAVKLLRKTYSIKEGLNIFIKKKIPIASGLGGGSSDAAGILLGLNKFWKLKITRKKILEFAQKLGADVSFFISAAQFALGLNRGDKIIPLKTKTKFIHTLVVPKIRVYSQDIYRKFDCLTLKLTKRHLDVKILTYVLENKDLLSLSKILFNALEAVTFKEYPGVMQVKERLSQLGLNNILMSGKGPAVFAIVQDRKEARRICNKLCRDKLGDVFVVETY